MKHLKLKVYLWLIFVISIVFYLILLPLFPIENNSILSYLKPVSKIIFLDSLFAWLFIKWFWKCKYFYSWLVPFPNLNGTWKGFIKSTWIDPKTNKNPPPIPVILTIKQSFINISCVMRTQEMESFSFICDFVIDEENQILRLVYSYSSNPKQTIKDRSTQHSGTIDFDIIYDKNEKKRELKGRYWTERKTTGDVELKFWKTELLHSYPKEIGEHPVSKIREEEKK